jgi:hypothetical protein
LYCLHASIVLNFFLCYIDIFAKGKVFVHWKYFLSILHLPASPEPTLHCHTFFHLKNIKLGHQIHPRNNHSSLLYRSNMPKKIKAFWRCQPGCPPHLYSILLQCWAYEPRERPTFGQLKHVLATTLQNETPLSSGLKRDGTLHRVSSWGKSTKLKFAPRDGVRVTRNMVKIGCSVNSPI